MVSETLVDLRELPDDVCVMDPANYPVGAVHAVAVLRPSQWENVRDAILVHPWRATRIGDDCLFNEIPAPPGVLTFSILVKVGETKVSDPEG